MDVVCCEQCELEVGGLSTSTEGMLLKIDAVLHEINDTIGDIEYRLGPVIINREIDPMESDQQVWAISTRLQNDIL